MHDASHDNGELPKAQGLPVAGYQPQSAEKIVTVNAFKAIEEEMLRVLDCMVGDHAFDQRWLAQARTSIENGFMQLNRSVFQPARLTDEQLAAGLKTASDLVAILKSGVIRSAR